MLRLRRTPLVFIGLIALFLSCREEKIDFSSQVKPILNKRCISCHGGVRQNGGFSVLFREEALDTAESGKRAIVPGHPEQSEMIRRLTLDDPEQRMPYKEEPLPDHEISILRKWIRQGAAWGDHWSYVPAAPVAVPVSDDLLAGPASSHASWPKNEIDHFILAGLRNRDLDPSPEAERATLIRRVYLDLTGIPPDPETAKEFITSADPDAFEKVVDDLLRSPHFGERWASWWLDLARYADTRGYEKDASRNIWRYRDWVIRAFNEDKPFDQFTTEQLAGDLYDNPTDELMIATAFHRNTMNNDEGGTDDEEFRVASVIDRVNTTYEIWQGTTMSCVQCHSHPYDPFRHEEYYRSMAFFNNTADEDTPGEFPELRMYDQAGQQKLEAIKSWVRRHSGEEKKSGTAQFLRTLEPKYHPHDFDAFVNGSLLDGKWLGIRNGGSARLKQVPMDGKTNLLFRYWMADPGGSVQIRKDGVNGEVIADVRLQKTKGSRVASIDLHPSAGDHDLYFIFRNSKLKADQVVCGVEWFAFRDGLPAQRAPGFADIQAAFDDLVNAAVESTPVMVENAAEHRRETNVFIRGNWMVKGTKVTPDVPRVLNDFLPELPQNRLGFARWLVSRDNPLTARVLVNRIWEQVFGKGIVETVEDFGSQGSLPSHPELLDWLALRMANEHQWSIKKLLKDIVMSATYRQDSRIPREAMEKDPENIALARAPRIRLSAEQIRDQALAASGLLSRKMYGPGVMPYQPEGIWQTVYSGEYWKKSEGEDQYRRGIYTFAKRTSPYPSMVMFDGSSREVCLSRRIRTNTPLQALVTLNDSVYVEAARFFARRMIGASQSRPDVIGAGYEMLTFRKIAPKKREILARLYQDALEQYAADQEACRKFIASDRADPALAATTVVAMAMLNLDEVIMKE